MVRMRWALMIGFALVIACVGVDAQHDDITVNNKATEENIHNWLVNNDPRLVAWGAYFAREHEDDAANAQLIKLAEGWTAGADVSGQYGGKRYNAMLDVLDALIVLRVSISLDGLRAVVDSFPNQAVILAAQLPAGKATPVLMEWYAKRDHATDDALPRIAAMLLSKAPPAGFAASVVSESEEKLSVTVVSGQMQVGYGGSHTHSCGDGFGVSTERGWPPVFRYGLEENAEGLHDPLLVSAGGERITYHRIDLHTGWGSCFDVHPLGAAARIDLIEQMLGASTSEFPWAVERNERLVWEDDAQYLVALRGLVAREEKQFRVAEERLVAKGYLTRAEMESVRPKLLVTVNDSRGPGSGKLPRVKAEDRRTVFEFKSE